MINCPEKDKKWFLECLNNKNLVEKIKNIKLIITDIDGCLTDGQILLHESENDKSKAFSVRDGYATVQCLKNILVAFLSGRKDLATRIRAKMLGIPDDMCFIGDDAGIDKSTKLNLLKEKNNVTTEETLMFGDDFLDINTRDLVGLLVCPYDTPFYFHSTADLIIPRIGGKHAFRLLLDLVLYIKGIHFAQDYINKALYS